MKKEIYFWIFLGICTILFSSWLMFHTFSYDQKSSSMLIASKAWSDFGAHIPLIRSFSMGNNWPPEYPLFPGEPIRYHFLFYFLAGMLEKIGLRIDWALNIPSVIGFAGLLLLIAVIAQKLFHDKRVTILSVVFFLFNGSLSFFRFFQTHPLSIHTVKDIITNTAFPSFAPWGPGEISAFWNLNIYTNQRHLAFAFALALLFISILLWIEKKPLKKQLIFLIPEVFILAIMPYFHQPILVILAVFMACYFILFPRLRVALLFIGTIGILYITPQLLQTITTTKSITWNPWYLMSSPYTLKHVISYWFQNFGLHILLIPLGWCLAPKKAKAVFLPAFLLFIVVNTIQFSSEIVGNHKFLNFFLIFGTMLSAYTIITVFSKIKKIIGSIGYLILVVLVFILTLSGLIDFFPIYNDGYMTLEDIPKNQSANWIRLNTAPQSIFLTQDFFMQPPSIAGRPIFMGWPYFPWSLGYDTYKRGAMMKQIFQSTSKQEACKLLINNNISYMLYNMNHIPDPNTQDISSLYAYNFTSLHQDTDGYIILDITQNCQ